MFNPECLFRDVSFKPAEYLLYCRDLVGGSSTRDHRRKTPAEKFDTGD